MRFQAGLWASMHQLSHRQAHEVAFCRSRQVEIRDTAQADNGIYELMISFKI
jgi:hypothetical protein